MLIFKYGKVADYKEFFAGTSFPLNGPSDDFLAENDAVKVNVFIEHDPETEKLVSCDPYVLEGWAYTVVVEQKTTEEIESEQAIRDAAHKAMVEAQRAEAYRNESDPLFFKSQRGEVTEQEWLDKVAEIKARYPME